jgi:hypothetical protein
MTEQPGSGLPRAVDGGFEGPVGATQNSAGEISLFALTSSGSIMGSSQSSDGGAFTAWTTIGTSNPDLVTPPDFTVLSDGVIVIFAGDSSGNIWSTSQSTIGGGFTQWQELPLA